MIEVWIGVGIFTVLFIVAAGGQHVSWNVFLIIGTAMVAVGLTVGVVVGISYHLALYRALAPTGILGTWWWWRPTSYNDRLPSEKRRKVMSWFYVGATSMIVALVGCALILAGILIMKNVF